MLLVEYDEISGKEMIWMKYFVWLRKCTKIVR